MCTNSDLDCHGQWLLQTHEVKSQANASSFLGAWNLLQNLPSINKSTCARSWPRQNPTQPQFPKTNMRAKHGLKKYRRSFKMGRRASRMREFADRPKTSTDRKTNTMCFRCGSCKGESFEKKMPIRTVRQSCFSNSEGISLSQLITSANHLLTPLESFLHF